jgi:hypothetical protein
MLFCLGSLNGSLAAIEPPLVEELAAWDAGVHEWPPVQAALRRLVFRALKQYAGCKLQRCVYPPPPVFPVP